jgi:hypothetical protein
MKDEMEKMRKNRTLLQDEKGNIRRRQDYTNLERLRIWLNRWWVFVLGILAVVQIINMVVTLTRK